MLSFFLLASCFQVVAQEEIEGTVLLDVTKNNYKVAPYLEVLPDPSGEFSIDDVARIDRRGGFLPLDSAVNSLKSPVHWLKFKVFNYASEFESYKLSVAYTDYVSLFTPTQNGSFILQKSGDLFTYRQRSVKNGQMIFMNLVVPHQRKETVYLKLESTTKISQQFRGAAINSLQIYPEKGYFNRFQEPRFYQAFFYGAIFIMTFYNLFIFISLRSKDYLFYVLYLLGIIIFFASNAGYMMELLLPDEPRIDLYIRFMSVPLLMFFYLQFSQGYLNSKQYSPRTHKFVNVLKGVFGLSIFLMLAFDLWKVGRMIFIAGAIISFITILILAIREIRRGYSPAKYFIAANLLLIFGALVFALPRIYGNVQNPLTQYGVQLGVLLEVSLFSIGLADRINVARRELQAQKEEQERLKIEREKERRRLIEEKNAELEMKVKERTREVVEQKEEIEKKNKDITASIKYGQRIQKALFGEADAITEYFNDSFIFFKPKDIVSGDFYWFGKVGDTKVLIAADCTGHGVPGAFMTMMGNAFLNDIVADEGIIEPDQILYELDKKVRLSLHQDSADSKRHDGMDVVVLTVNEVEGKLMFAGAKNPLCRVQNGEIERIKGSSAAIGGYDLGKKKVFEKHELPLVKGDVYYLYSDGYQDQFGKNGRKFMSKKFRELLQNLSHLPMQEQHKQLDEIMQEWMGEEASQTDDILVVGLRI